MRDRSFFMYVTTLRLTEDSRLEERCYLRNVANTERESVASLIVDSIFVRYLVERALPEQVAKTFLFYRNPS